MFYCWSERIVFTKLLIKYIYKYFEFVNKCLLFNTNSEWNYLFVEKKIFFLTQF